MNNICQSCKKARATVHLTEIDPDNNQPHEMHLCEQCASNSAPAHKPQAASQPAKFTTSLISINMQSTKPRSGARRLVCSTCGMSLQEFRLKGRFGCPHCYEVFEDNLASLLEKVHGANKYVGPSPAAAPRPKQAVIAFEQELLDLKRRLGKAVKAENYEEAARIRDRIQEVERSLAESRDE